MRLKIGQAAPLFGVQDIYGRYVSLAHFAGAKLLLSFNRAAVCPLCDLRMWHLIDRYATYQRYGFNIVAFIESSPQMAHRYLDKMRAPFPVIADIERQFYSLYGLESSWFGAVRALLGRQPAYIAAARHGVGGNPLTNLTRMDGKFGRLPADFLVGPDGRIRVAYYGKDAGDFLRFADIDRFIASV